MCQLKLKVYFLIKNVKLLFITYPVCIWFTYFKFNLPVAHKNKHLRSFRYVLYNCTSMKTNTYVLTCIEQGIVVFLWWRLSFSLCQVKVHVDSTLRKTYIPMFDGVIVTFQPSPSLMCPVFPYIHLWPV